MDIPLSLSERATASEPPPAPDDIIDKLAAGDPAALARCITLMESGGPTADCIHRRVCAKAGRAAVIGFTGAPGAGKSTLIDAYIGALRALGSSVAVAAVDPSSPISGSAILGDRVRMRRLIAQSAGRVVHNRIGDDVSEEMEGLVKAAASGEIGIAEAARRALTIIR